MDNNVLVAQESDIIEVNAETFYKHFKYAKDNGLIENTERVLLRPLKHYKTECKSFFMIKDYSAGVAIEYSGRIISVFSTQKFKGAGTLLIQKAIKDGGIKLECNDVDHLRSLYLRNGFLPVCKGDLDKNDIYWDILKKKGDNNVVIVFWIYDAGDSVLGAIDRKKLTIKDVNIKCFDNEEEAENFRDKILDDWSNLSDETKAYLNSVIIRN